MPGDADLEDSPTLLDRRTLILTLAGARGLTIPSSLLVRADRVFE